MIQEILKEKIIERKIYLKRINNFLNTPLIKVLIWARRVGKSSILKKIIQINYEKWNFWENFFYVNKEDLKFDFIKDYLDLQKEFDKFLKKIDKNKKIFVAIDEVQEIKSWEKFVNSLLSKYKSKIEIFVTWSNSSLLSSDLASLLTWRYIDFKINPLSFWEFLKFSWKKKSKKEFLKYLEFGWMPWIFETNFSKNAVNWYLKWVYNSILLKDIVKYFWVKNLDFLETLYKFILVNIWNTFSAKKISDYLKSQKIKISVDSILNYLKFWEKAFLINKVKTQDIESKKIFEVYDKFYIEDLWIRNSIVGFELSRDIWKLLENYVFNVLKFYSYEVKIWRLKVYDKNIWKYKNLEIDFVATKNWKKKYFQVCYLLNWEETIKREFWNLELINDSWSKYVVSFDEIDFWEKNWIKHINIMDLEKVL